MMREIGTTVAVYNKIDKGTINLETPLTEAELGYLAGIIDGEGCIGVYRSKDGVFGNVVITNTDVRLIAWIASKLGDYNNCTAHRKHNWKEWYTIQFYGMNAVSLLKIVYPYLLIKKGQANNLLQYYEWRATVKRKSLGHRYGWKGFTPEEKEIQYNYVRTSSILNKKGQIPDT